MKAVLDTSALLYWCFSPELLGAAAVGCVQTAEELIVSTISLWEVALKVDRGRLELPLGPREFAQKLEMTQRVRVVAVDWPTWLASVELRWEHRDPADRVLVALAERLHLPLVTSDREILGFFPRAIW